MESPQNVLDMYVSENILEFSLSWCPRVTITQLLRSPRVLSRVLQGPATNQRKPSITCRPLAVSSYLHLLLRHRQKIFLHKFSFRHHQNLETELTKQSLAVLRWCHISCQPEGGFQKSNGCSRDITVQPLIMFIYSINIWVAPMF